MRLYVALLAFLMFSSTCADDVALIAYNPLDIQTMVDIAVDFSKREGYQLQPATSVILPVKSKIKTIETKIDIQFIQVST
jgi:hypothetical protein